MPCEPFKSEMTMPSGRTVTMTGFVCSRGKRKPRTWACECGHSKNTANDLVCQKCGLYRDGCKQCDADVLPVEGAPYQRGVMRLHKCSNPQCGWVTKA